MHHQLLNERLKRTLHKFVHVGLTLDGYCKALARTKSQTAAVVHRCFDNEFDSHVCWPSVDPESFIGRTGYLSQPALTVVHVVQPLTLTTTDIQ